MEEGSLPGLEEGWVLWLVEAWGRGSLPGWVLLLGMGLGLQLGGAGVKVVQVWTQLLAEGWGVVCQEGSVMGYLLRVVTWLAGALGQGWVVVLVRG